MTTCAKVIHLNSRDIEHHVLKPTIYHLSNNKANIENNPPRHYPLN